MYFMREYALDNVDSIDTLIIQDGRHFQDGGVMAKARVKNRMLHTSR